MQVTCASLPETKKFAADVTNKLKERKGDKATVLALVGNLGSGKTELTKHIAELLGIKKQITSPTFVLRNDYATEDEVFNTLHHIDAYRIDEKEDTIGLEDVLLDGDALVVIEWADKLQHALPENTPTVHASVTGSTHTFSIQNL